MNEATEHPGGSRSRELFIQAQQIENESHRCQFLDQACGTDKRLRLEVQELLQIHQRTGDFLSHAATGEALNSPGEHPGTQIGRYRLMELLGEGGFGVVWRAEQTEPLKRQVALKIIKLGMDTREVVARFEAERQALALMDHPGISKVFDAGCTEQGRPYFVMDLARGEPLTDYCDRECLPLKARVQLFQQVCEAVQHAHQRGIIHRDLKPTNVVVTLPEGKPVVKIIDFGIAKSMQGRLTDRTLITCREILLGTPVYMSPEQLNLDSEEIDKRSDIYSLGVMLYELVAGALPFETSLFNRVAFSEVHRILRETEPPVPSVRLQQLGGQISEIARCRSMTPKALVKRLRGDLDRIVMAAIEKDRSRRFASAMALAQDLGNWLQGKPVGARPIRFYGRWQRWCRREPRLAALLTGLILLLTAVAALTSTLLFFQKSHLVEMEQIRERSRDVLIRRIESNRLNDVPVHVSAEEVAIITRNELLSDGTEERMVLGVRTREKNSNRMVPPFGRLAQWLQIRLWESAQLPTQFDLVLYSSEDESREGVLRQEAQLFRLDPAAFLLTHRQSPGNVILVQEAEQGSPRHQGAIVTRSDSPIHDLGDLTSIAFGEKGTAFGWYVPRALLARAGLRSHQLIQETNLASTQVLTALLEHRVDAGIVEMGDLEKMTAVLPESGPGYRVLQSFHCPSLLWMITPSVEPSMATALQEVMLSLEEPAILKILDSSLTGFVPVAEDDLHELEQHLESATHFETP